MRKSSPLIVFTAVVLAGCGSGKQQQPPAPPTPQVGFVTVSPQSATLSTELAARTAAYETSEIRPQVNGLITARLFQEGDEVRAGQPLYRIDPQPYQAQVASARAALARAKAAIASNDALARRYGELVKINAIARQDYENAITTAQQARADVAAQEAALRTATIDLGRTTVKAPISGRIGRSAVTTGGLVTASQTTALSTIQRLDPIYVDITQSSVDQLRLRKQLLEGNLSRGANAARIRLKLEDGTLYPVEGIVKFADVTVDPATGSQTIRAQFSNPNRLLLPGMYVTAQFVEGTQANALLVPQRAVSRDEKGNAVVMVVGPGNKIVPKTLTAPRTIGDNWLVTAGLAAGDRVIVEGAQNLQPGTPVKPVQWTDKAAKPGAQQPANASAAGKGQ
ncbi:efflux RND transporter periplasmic adaptor subunit [Sphingomonas sp. PvP056]|uniref:efflux RND transporter periplasmic adaptor subunit n=1 Tax=Sphingomonas sp. PvP056 TaxID=3156392 RepID=UPI0033909998